MVSYNNRSKMIQRSGISIACLMRRDQVHTILVEVGIEAIAVIRPIPDEMLGLGLEHVEVETELHQGDLMMIRRMCAHGEGQTVPIHNRQDFHALAALREANGLAAALGRRKRGVDETLAFIKGPFVTPRVRQLGEDLSQTSCWHHCWNRRCTVL